MMVQAYVFFALLLAGLSQGSFAPSSGGGGLVDVNEFYVDVIVQRYGSSEPNDSAFAFEMGELLRDKLNDAGISAIAPTLEQLDEAAAAALTRTIPGGQSIDPNRITFVRANVPSLRFVVDLVVPQARDSLAMYVRGSFSRRVSLGGRNLSATVWNARPVITALPTIKRMPAGTMPPIRMVSVADWREEVREALLGQADAFIVARKAAAAHDGKPTTAVAEDAIDALGYPYVASKSSTVFHRADCRMAGNIASENLIGYNSRDDAVAAGKRPCKTCDP